MEADNYRNKKPDKWYIKYISYIIVFLGIVFLGYTLPKIVSYIKDISIFNYEEREKNKITILLPDMEEVYLENINILANRFCLQNNNINMVSRDNKYTTIILCKDNYTISLPLDTVLNFKK